MALNGIEEKKNDNYVGKVEDRLKNRVDSQGRQQATVIIKVDNNGDSA